MRRPAPLALLLAVALLAPLTGCQRDTATIGEAGNPVVLVLSPAHGTADSAARLERELSRRAGIVVDIRVAASAEDAVAMAGTPHVDGGVLSLFEYLLAHQRFGVEARLQLLRGDEARSHRGVLVVREDAPARTLADLAGARVAYVDRASTTGYLLPAHALADAGVTVSPTFAGSHDAALAAVRDGRVVAAATYARATPPPGTRVLATTGELPNEPVFFAPHLAAATRERLVAALVELAGQPDGRALLGELADATGVIAVTDALYAPVDGVLAATARELEDLVPGAWRLTHQQRAATSDLGAL